MSAAVAAGRGRRLAVLAILGFVAAVSAADTAGGGGDSAPEDAHDGNRFTRLATYIKIYAATNGLGMMLEDEDIKCLLQVGNAVRQDSSHSLLQPAATLYRLVMNTTPRCKLSLLAKSRMFIRPGFAKGVIATLLSLDTKESSQ